MNRMYKIVCLLAVSAICTLPLKTTAQNESDIAGFLEAGPDASKLFEAYLTPIIKGASYGMAGGWYNTAKPHKTLGFDLGVTMSLAFVPTSENFFDPSKLGLQNTTYVGGKPMSDPGTDPASYDPSVRPSTIFGPKSKTQYTSTVDGQNYTFGGPEGFDMKKEIGFAGVPVPMAQLGIGIVKNTDIKVRFVPKTEVEGNSISVFGLGIMHDIKQHVPGIKMLPFDLSALVAYSTITGSSDLSNNNNNSGPVSDNGELNYKFNSWVLQALISKKISVLTGYAGIGYSIVNTKFDVTGDYELYSDGAETRNVTDPIDIDFKNNSLRLTVGMRLKLGPVFLNGDYTIQKYNTLTVGFGFAVR